MQIVIEAVSERLAAIREPPFPGVPKGRMPDVVDQRQRLGQIRVEVQRPGHGAGHLRHFDGVRQAVAEMIGIARGEDLRLRLEAPERPRMNDAVAVPRVVVAVAMPRLRPAPPARPVHVLRKSSQRHAAILCQLDAPRAFAPQSCFEVYHSLSERPLARAVMLRVGRRAHEAMEIAPNRSSQHRFHSGPATALATARAQSYPAANRIRCLQVRAKQKDLDDFVTKYPGSVLIPSAYRAYYVKNLQRQNYPQALVYLDKLLALAERIDLSTRREALIARAQAYTLGCRNEELRTPEAYANQRCRHGWAARARQMGKATQRDGPAV